MSEYEQIAAILKAKNENPIALDSAGMALLIIEE